MLEFEPPNDRYVVRKKQGTPKARARKRRRVRKKRGSAFRNK